MPKSKLFVPVSFALLAGILLPIPITSAAPKALKCEVGPVTKTYGKTQWLVYSCDDGRSLVIVALPGSTASPFVFMLLANEKGHSLSGEGNGNREATEAAKQDLGKLSESDIAALIAETKGKP